MSVRVQSDPFDMGAEVADFAPRAAPEVLGAVVTFSGLVRDEGGTLNSMEIEHYPGMTEKALTAIRDEAHGTLVAGRCHDHPPTRVVEARRTDHDGRHRRASPQGDAFAAAEFLMDYLKSRAPFWKKEIGAEGADWVAAKDEDEAALGRWSSDD